MLTTNSEDMFTVDMLLIDVWRETLSKRADEHGELSRDALRGALGIREDIIADRVFSLIEDVTPAHTPGAVRMEAFLSVAERLVYGSPREKIMLLFRFHDLNGDGRITRDEMTRMMEASLQEHGLIPAKSSVQDLVEAFFNKADTNRDNTITCDEFIALAARDEGVLERFTLGGLGWIVNPPARRAPKAAVAPVVTGWRSRREAPLLAALALYGVACVGVASYAAWRYANAGVWVQLARACGALLNLNGALILVPMMRRLLTAVRRTSAAKFLPLDHNVIVHRVIGHVLLWGSLVHTAAHLMNAMHVPGLDPWRLTFATRIGLTGCAALLALGALAWFARDAVRRGGHFERFYRSHMAAFVVWFVAALFHGPVFWQWVGIPCAVFVVEHVLGWRARRAPVEVVGLTALPSSVTRVELRRPGGFDYQAGDYVYLCLPWLARHEFHPFTLTSAPEDTEHLSVHVRSLGNWTRALHARASQIAEQAAPHEATKDAPMFAYLDGPYGTASGHIFEARRAVLVGAGIGVTPFASILRSILLRHRRGEALTLERVHFFWINRDQAAFEWFSALLTALEAADVNHILTLHIYMTGAQRDVRSGGLDAAMEILYRETGTDLITGLHARTKRGRPDWLVELQRIRAEAPEIPCDVFFCGPPAISRELAAACLQLGLGFREEHF